MLKILKEVETMGGARGGRRSKRTSAKARQAMSAARAARTTRKKRPGRGLMPAPATSASATDVSRELEASPGADQSAEFGMGVT
jgi:hypothetical protein